MFSEVSKQISEVEYKKLDALKLMALGIGFTLKPTSIHILTSTTAQLKYALSLLEKKRPRELIAENITDAVWHVFNHHMKVKIKVLRQAEGCSVKFDSGKVTIVFEEEQDKLAKELDAFVRKLLTMESAEEFIVKEENSEDAWDWCKTLESVGGKNSYAVFVEEGNTKKIIAMCDLYEDMGKMKHKIKVLQNVIKPKNTGREHNTGGAIENLLDCQPPSPVSKQTKFDWNVDAKNKKTFKTTEGLDVFVYQADICRLPIDCIVNAANDTLSHGGGVAAAIARAAGDKLNEQGKAYIKQNGPIAVGNVYVTTAGNLPYKCVIHAVGPRWNSRWNSTEEILGCATDLKNAVFNSLKEAENLKLNSVGLPAISSGKHLSFFNSTCI